MPTAPANKKAFSYHSSSLGSFCPSNPALFLEAKTRSRYERFADFCRMGAAQMESLCSSAHGAAERKSNEKSAAAEHIQWHKTKSHPMIGQCSTSLPRRSETS